MARATRSAAHRLTARESAGRKGALRRDPLGHPPAEFGSTGPTTASGRIPRKFSYWDSRPDLLNEISGRDSGKEPIPCTGNPFSWR
jgi:hypothetical protein